MITLEVRRPDPRGPAYLGELITSGPCSSLDPVLNTVDVNLDPYPPPPESIRVLLYVNGKYAGVATLGPDGFVEDKDTHSPWFNIRDL